MCTLVTTIQTYKILSLTSLISAYSLSALHMQALKFSEIQSTILGISAAINYYYFSNSKPLRKISGVKPSKSVFEVFIFFLINLIKILLFF